MANQRGLVGWNPKQYTPAEEVVRYTKEVGQLKYKLYVAKRMLAKFQAKAKGTG